MKDKKSKYVIHYLPYLKISKTIKLGKVQFFSFPEQINMVDCSKLILFIEKIKNSYRYAIDKPIQSITLAKYFPKPWTELTDEEQNIIWQATIILCFCCLAANEFSPNKPYRNSSNFQLVTQYVNLDSNYFSIQTRRRWGITLTGGYKWGDYMSLF